MCFLGRVEEIDSLLPRVRLLPIASHLGSPNLRQKLYFEARIELRESETLPRLKNGSMLYECNSKKILDPDSDPDHFRNLIVCSLCHCLHFSENFVKICRQLFKLFFFLQTSKQTNIPTKTRTFLLEVNKISDINETFLLMPVKGMCHLRFVSFLVHVFGF